LKIDAVFATSFQSAIRKPQPKQRRPLRKIHSDQYSQRRAFVDVSLNRDGQANRRCYNRLRRFRRESGLGGIAPTEILIFR